MHTAANTRGNRQNRNIEENPRRILAAPRQTRRLHPRIQKNHNHRTQTHRQAQTSIAGRDEVNLENTKVTIGLDTNILCYALDSAFPEHNDTKKLLLNLSPKTKIALNPTIIHETYHTLVFSLQWVPEEAATRLSMLLKHPHIEFFNQTKQTTQIALNLSVKHGLGGRDALITANFLANKVQTVYTHDKGLLALRELSWKNSHLNFKDPTKTKTQQ
jgi:predicted nucleic acid-binding protein